MNTEHSPHRVLRRQRYPLFIVGGVVFGLACPARAASPADAARASTPAMTPTATQPLQREAPTVRPHALITGGVGMIGLPAAQVCSSPSTPCRPGEASLALSLANVVRWGRIGIGAGADVAFGLRPEQGVRAAGRDHVRSYYAFDALFRYYLPLARRVEWWVGGSIGAIVLSDTWSTAADRAPYSDLRNVGPQRLTLRTEGLSVGPSIGGHWRFRDRWVIGSQFRYMNWFLPTGRAKTAFDDSASLAGRIDVFDVGVFLGFRGIL